MSVSRGDVRHIAELARIGVPADRLDTLVTELNGILAHMDALRAVRTDSVADQPADAPTTPPLANGGSAAMPFATSESRAMPLAADQPPAVVLQRARELFAPHVRGTSGALAPSVRDGFFLVPRLETHEDQGDTGHAS